MKFSIRSPGLMFVPLTLAFGACNGGGAGSAEPDAGGYDTSDSSVTSIHCDGRPVGDVERRTRYQAEVVEADSECMPQEQTRVCQEDGAFGAWSGDYVAEVCSVQGFAACGASPHGTSEERTTYETALVPFGVQCRAQTQTRTCEDGEWDSWNGTFTFLKCEVEGAPSCGSTPHGSSASQMRYEASEVPFGSTCKAETQTRLCTAGAWSVWSGTFQHENCRVVDAASCGDSPHDTLQSRTLYQAALVKAGETCKAETQERRCNDGAWTAFTGSFSEEKCDVEGKRRCGDIAHGQEARQVRYPEAEVPYGAECVPEHQTALCSDGTLGEFSGESTSEVCVVAKPKDCEGGKHGEERTQSRYEAGVVEFGQQCKSELQKSTCSNGVWSAYTGSFTFTGCVVTPPKDCEGGRHGEERTQPRYEAGVVEFGQQCKSELQKSTCSNGAWSAYTGSFTFTGCVVAEPKDCEGGRHGEERTRQRYQAASVAFGQQCKIETQASLCTNGKWSAYGGSYTFAGCEVLPPPPCDGVAHGQAQTRQAYQAATVPADQACKSEQQTRTCNAGSWSAWSGSYTALSCRVLGETCTDYLTNTVFADGESQSRVHYEAPFPSGKCKPETQTRLCTDGSFDDWSGTYQSEGCGPLSTITTGATSCRLYQLIPSFGGIVSCSEFRGYAASEIGCSSATKDDTHGCPTGGSAFAKCTHSANGKSSASFYYSPPPATVKSGCTQNGGVWTEF